MWNKQPTKLNNHHVCLVCGNMIRVSVFVTCVKYCLSLSTALSAQPTPPPHHFPLILFTIMLCLYDFYMHFYFVDQPTHLITQQVVFNSGNFSVRRKQDSGFILNFILNMLFQFGQSYSRIEERRRPCAFNWLECLCCVSAFAAPLLT